MLVPNPSKEGSTVPSEVSLLVTWINTKSVGADPSTTDMVAESPFSEVVNPEVGDTPTEATPGNGGGGGGGGVGEGDGAGDGDGDGEGLGEGDGNGASVSSSTFTTTTSGTSIPEYLESLLNSD